LPARQQEAKGFNQTVRKPGKQRLAIVGAGPAGLAAAWKLRDADDIEITVFEKSLGLLGRAATRSRHGLRLDPGANYFRTDLPEVAELIHDQLSTNELIQINGDVDVFDRHGGMAAGDSTLNGETKWTYRSGINTLGKMLAAAAGCEICYGVRIAQVRWQRGTAAWRLTDVFDVDRGVFDAVLLVLPAPQAIELVGPEEADVAEALSQATYQSQWSFTFGFDAGEVTWPGDFYALVNQDRQHRIAWLSRENAKRNRVPEHTLVVMAQMQPEWSLVNFEEPAEQLALEVAAMIAELFGWGAADFRWLDVQRWRFSLPTGRADVDMLRAAESRGLYVAGDSVVGKGRVAYALQTGLDVAERIRGR
jgi:predicted NAD/FAD-dependent oxidoreductase